jgi:hypothetical protein
MIPATLKPGTEVVCIDDGVLVDGWGVKSANPSNLEYGKIYTVIGFNPRDEMLPVMVQEATNHYFPWAFGRWRFRLLEKTVIDLEKLTHLHIPLEEFV